MASTLERVQNILVEKMSLDKEEVTLEASLKNDLQLDSLDAVDLIMDLEDEFDIKIEDEDAQKFETVGNIVSFVDAQTSA